MSIPTTAIDITSTERTGAGDSFPASDRRHGADLRHTALTFAPNVGQAPASALFVANAGRAQLLLEQQGFTLATRSHASDAGGAKWTLTQFSFLGSNDQVRIGATDETPAKVNWLVGNDPAQWKQNVPVYSRVRYHDLYPGIDLVFYGRLDGTLEYDFVVAPGADPSQIRFGVVDETSGATSRINAEGGLGNAETIGFQLGRPMLYQNVSTGKTMLGGHFSQDDEGVFSFKIPTYDRARPLIIDPTFTLAYSTYLGGQHFDGVNGMVIDQSGNTYITGVTSSPSFPVSGTAYQSAFAQYFGTGGDNGFISKLNSQGILLYSTFLGGPFVDLTAIAVDATGHAYVTGITEASSYPTTSNAFESTFQGSDDVVLSELSADGSSLVYSTFYNGTAREAFATAITLDQQGSVYVAGLAPVAGLPTTSGAFQATPMGGDASFVAKFDLTQSGQTQLIYGTYLGGSAALSPNVGNGNRAGINGLAVDSSGQVYVGGETYSSDFPTTSNAFQKSPALRLAVNTQTSCSASTGPVSSGFLTILNPTGSGLVYSSYFGGKTLVAQAATQGCEQSINSVQLDAQGDIYLYGLTPTSDIGTSGAYQSSGGTFGGMFYGVEKAFVAKFAPAGATLIYSSYIGGGYTEAIGGATNGHTFVVFRNPIAEYSLATSQNTLAVDSAGDAYFVAEVSTDTSLPTTAGALYTASAACVSSNLNCPDLYIGELSPAGSTLLYGTDYGSTTVSGSPEYLAGIAVDGGGTLYVAGATSDSALPTTSNAYQSAVAGDYDAFFSILSAGGLQISGSTVGGNIGDVTITLTGENFQAGASCSLTLGNVTIASISAVVSTSGGAITCTFPLSGVATGLYSVSVQNGSAGTYTTANSFTVQSGVGPQLSVSITGRSVIRVNTPSTFYINYNNNGDTDALDSRIWVTLPDDVRFNLAAIPYVTALDGLNQPEQDELPYGFTDANGNTQISILVPRIPAGTSGSIPIVIQGATLSTAEEQLSAFITPFWFSSTAQSAVLTALNRNGGNSPTGYSGSRPDSSNSSNATFQQCFTSYRTFLVSQLNLYLQLSKLNLLGSSALAAGKGLATNIFNLNPNQPATYLPVVLPAAGAAIAGANGFTSTSAALSSLGAEVAGATGLSLSSTAPFVAGLGAILLAAETNYFFQTSQSITCQQYFGMLRRTVLNFIIKASQDPNQLGGPNGTGTPNFYIPAAQPLDYSISFENEPTAALPAANVTITDQLNPASLDFAKTSLGPIAFGTTLLFPPSGVSSYNSTVNLSSSLNVAVSALINKSSGLATWTFQSIDPATGQPPSDPTVGFLPPDIDGVGGQGSVSIVANPLGYLTTGAQITDGANVVFDTNEAISTNIWLNTLDVTPPTSTITALPATEIAASGQTTNFNVTWSGSDAGSGIATYNIYSSDTGAPYTLWQNAVTTTSASFTGTVGHTYSFYSISTDNAGNVQASKTTPDTTTSVVSVFTTTTTLTSSVTTAQVGTSIVLTATVTPSSGGGVPTGSIDFVDGTNQISSGSLNSAGVATYTSAALSIGTHSIAAVYRGDANNAASTSASVSIVITAIPDFSIALTPTSGSVTPAGSVTTSITITPLNGFAQTVALSCSNLPADATCSINPASITPNGTSDSTAMVTIRTDGSSAAALRRTADPLHGHGERTALISFGAIIFATFSMLRRRRLSTWGVTLLMAGLLLASYGLSGCASPHASTPPGTYSVTISGVAGTDSHTATYTLTIQ